MTTVLSKNQVRQRVRKALSAISTRDYQSKSRSICNRLQRMELWNNVATVHLFWPLLTAREPDIRPFIMHLLSIHKRIVLPVVQDFSRKTGNRPRLQHWTLEDTSKLKKNKWGILEPEIGTDVPVSDLEAIVVPALAVDKLGNRLGNGFGYYDEFLANVNVPLVCPLLNKAHIHRISEEPHDVRMTYIVTESGTWDLSKT